MFALPDNLAREGLLLRPVADGDGAFQRALFASARLDAMYLVAWPAEQREPFLDQQFHFQSIHYARFHPGADFLILECHRVPIGRLILEHDTPDWHIVDIALLPQTRRQGTGGALLRALQDGVRAAGAAGIMLNVEVMNEGAQRLYRRLGFVPREDHGAHVEMYWAAAAS
jgi:ribosomal protein S18 acetylase RimI-like enzyme